ncbi:pilus assembly protein TadE [Phycicoccus sp. CSK15P-2]|uniref:TadE family type IV pilus minor pilin n=1 Tax=Phycicoccus sp. CSK15P-2 TaxID=2807627 RepID=UPI00194F61A1|nr:TadE family type IV pilus minor pilin [Phycicoccus sp. CSK15P-2]MBM6404591.1 pilus assembly protein TadE [Phycicoccus sp. CSK15P-2]
MTRRGEEGTATAELAVAVPVLLLVLAVALSAVRMGVDQVRCVDAAHTAARLLARGEPRGVATAAATRHAPEGARVRVSPGAGSVTVRVGCPAPAALRRIGVPDPPPAGATARLESADGPAS